MSIVFHRVKEGEFKRMVEAGAIDEFVVQESKHITGKFHLLGIKPAERIGYTVRHGRVDELRTWRVDILAQLLKEWHVRSFKVQYYYD